MASRMVSSQALATIGSLLSIDEIIPLRKVFVIEFDCRSFVGGEGSDGGVDGGRLRGGELAGGGFVVLKL